MIENSPEELAFLACLNDIHSLKKQKYIEYFEEHSSINDLYYDIFKVNQNTRKVYAEKIRLLIDKSVDIRDKKILEPYSNLMRDYQNRDVRILPFYDSEYPQKVKKISNPPFIIFQKGKREFLLNPAVAVVGTRKISPEGVDKVRDIVETCVRLDYVIVSGLALGTDTYAHKKAIQCGGKTIAVLPTDIDNIIPADNQKLAEQITKSGCLISEVTHFAKMHKGRYLERNRITSALSDAVIIIESGEKGGSMRQADIAFKQGKKVYSVRPEDSNAYAIAGHEKLLSNGAISIESSKELSQYLLKINETKTMKGNKTKMATFADFS